MKPLTLRDIWCNTRKADRDLPLEVLVGSVAGPLLAVVRRSTEAKAETATALIFTGASEPLEQRSAG